MTPDEARTYAPGPLVYRARDVDGRVIYIGHTKDLGKRLLSHHFDARNHEDHWLHLAVSFDVEHHACIEDARDAEREALRTERPPYNRQHTGHPYMREVGAWVGPWMRRRNAARRDAGLPRGAAVPGVAPDIEAVQRTRAVSPRDASGHRPTPVRPVPAGHNP